MGFRDTEHTFYAVRVPHANLDVGLFQETGCLVDWVTFHEYAADRANFGGAIPPSNSVKGLYHGTIQWPPQTIASVIRKITVGRVVHIAKLLMCRTDLFDI